MGDAGDATGRAGEPDDPIRPLDWLKAIPFEPAAWSDRLGWVGLEAVCCRTEPAFELDQPALTHHWLALFVPAAAGVWTCGTRGSRRHRPPPAGSIMLVPAGSPAGWRRGQPAGLAQHLPGAGVGRAGGRRGVRPRPGELTVPPLDGLELPHLRAAMTAVGA